MISDITGRVWQFGDRIDTDVIISGKYLNLDIRLMKSHVLEAVNPEFAREVRQGDVIIAGRLFGCGSSREAAPASIKSLGIAAVVADSFARTFYRNAIAIGLPAIHCPGVSAIFNQGNEAVIEFTNNRVINATLSRSMDFMPFPEDMLRVLESGGVEMMLTRIFRKKENG